MKTGLIKRNLEQFRLYIELIYWQTNYILMSYNHWPRFGCVIYHRHKNSIDKVFQAVIFMDTSVTQIYITNVNHKH